MAKMFEHHEQPMASRHHFYIRMVRFTIFAIIIILLSLFVGVWGYHKFEGLSWVDSLLNSAMILGGMGPVNQIHTVAGKIFASFYALFSGVIFLVIAGLLFAPIFHRFLHHFHLEIDE
jgi:hypothetical protein